MQSSPGQSGRHASHATAPAFGAARFEALWKRKVVHSTASPATAYATLDRLLGAPGRHFHNLDHIRDCIVLVDEVAPLLGDADAVELALWFHDAVLEPGARDNERRSAALFLELADRAEPALRRRVATLVLATAHADRRMSGDRGYVVDIDLAGLGAPWDAFMHKGSLLRREASKQDDADYYRAQVAFLGRLLARPRLYATDYFRANYEAQARSNLSRLLALRATQGYAS
jgi:predicted metal-dependent HD superfamily phosphohydrolase